MFDDTFRNLINVQRPCLKYVAELLQDLPTASTGILNLADMSVVSLVRILPLRSPIPAPTPPMIPFPTPAPATVVSFGAVVAPPVAAFSTAVVAFISVTTIVALAASAAVTTFVFRPSTLPTSGSAVPTPTMSPVASLRAFVPPLSALAFTVARAPPPAVVTAAPLVALVILP